MSDFNLFVYGTLRSSGSPGGPLALCEKVADASIGGTLYDIDGRFPALVYYGTDAVQGEVWRCPVALLQTLDEYESVAAGLFRRIAAEVQTGAGVRVPCWVYTVGPALSRQLTPANRVMTGSWRRRIER